MGHDWLARYLTRIGYVGSPRPDIETLRALQQAHFLHVPFENLDIQRRVPIVADLEANFEKVVARRRGGWCLELNGLLAWALREIGFRVDMLGARVMSTTGGLGEPLTHMTLLVHLDEPWIADVGFGGGRMRMPLRVAEREPQNCGAWSYVVANDGDHWFVSAHDPWLAPAAPRTYLFTLERRELGDFEEACEWLQTSPRSSFTLGDVVSIGREFGRTTFSQGRLIVADGEGRSEREVGAGEVAGVLEREFGILPG